MEWATANTETERLRRFLLASVIVTIYPGSDLQIFVALFFGALLLSVTLLYKPYVLEADNVLAHAAASPRLGKNCGWVPYNNSKHNDHLPAD